MNSLPTDEPLISDSTVLDDPVVKPSGRSRFIGFIQVAAIAAFMVVAILFAQERSEPVAAGGIGSPVAAKAALSVKVLRPQVQTSSETLVTTGNVVIRNSVALVSQVSGRIQYLAPALKAGGAFAAGDLLLRIDSQDFQLAIAQAQAEIDSAQANLALQQAQSEAAIGNYALLNGKKTVPPLVAKLPQIQQGQALLAGAKARAQVALLNLSRTELRMPFAGKVTQTTAEVGQLLTQGVAFGQVFALDAVEASVPIAPSALNRLQPIVGRSAQVSDGVVSVSATVERVSAELDAQTRFARLYLQLPPNSMPPGTFVQVSFAGPALDNTMLLPIAAEQPNGRVWTVSASQLVAAEPTTYFRTATHLVVEAFAVGEGVVIGAVPGGRDGLEVVVSSSE
jgi:RND family efflux transporter MFP subunit